MHCLMLSYRCAMLDLLNPKWNFLSKTWVSAKKKIENNFTLHFCNFTRFCTVQRKMKRRKKHTILSASLLHNIIFENYEKLNKSLFRNHEAKKRETYLGAGKISESFLFLRSFNDFFIALTFIVSHYFSFNF